MITKFKTIKNLAVFQNFVWDNSVLDKNNKIEEFKKINIIYGRNYSGKTTLSRIVRSLEKGKICDKYKNPEFEVSIKNLDNSININNLNSHQKIIRVFNKDFIKENLRFFVNPDENIEPFAITGTNAGIQEEIDQLQSTLGRKKESEESKETGFYLELKNANEKLEKSKKDHENEISNLDKKLDNKANHKEHGIRYKSDRFGDQNYNKDKIKKELVLVTNESFVPLTKKQIEEKDALRKEKINQNIDALSKHTIDISKISSKAEALIIKPISSSDKIEKLVKDSVLNRWVKDGRQYHKDKLDKCSFCGSDITDERWKKLDSHFDEESEKLEKEIDALIIEISERIESLKNCLIIDKEVFYSKYKDDIGRLINIKEYVISQIKLKLNNILDQLRNRKNDILNTKIFTSVSDNSNRLDWCWQIFEYIRKEANNYSSILKSEQDKAKKLLRLTEVFDFANTIQYSSLLSKINDLKTTFVADENKKIDIELKIKNHEEMIENKRRSMNDEETGALKVNEYLNNYFGHKFLSLKALEDSEQFGGKKIRFEIIRDNKKAYNLSEGECSLIAFCYFMAKLEDNETTEKSPIIWIDDPISSLDSDHIFFIYSLISSKIVEKNNFEQLFIATHNLDFLKYLKRLPSEKRETQKFIIQRESIKSQIKLMPSYLKDYVTEFNFLFHQIYKIAKTDLSKEENLSICYNFGNNARKFLEALLFYKYPSKLGKESRKANEERLLKYFKNDNLKTALIQRVTNEYSHLEETLDRGMVPIENSELFQKVAQLILDQIHENDKDQYEALLESIEDKNLQNKKN
jgi:wobble nucleotide-excising tRNase